MSRTGLTRVKEHVLSNPARLHFVSVVGNIVTKYQVGLLPTGTFPGVRCVLPTKVIPIQVGTRVVSDFDIIPRSPLVELDIDNRVSQSNGSSWCLGLEVQKPCNVFDIIQHGRLLWRDGRAESVAFCCRHPIDVAGADANAPDMEASIIIAMLADDDWCPVDELGSGRVSQGLRVLDNPQCITPG
ncbi:uncharacterized protein PG986_015091 [Apiospora aurea]|uniref:Uncharacterized protein n=1 Tax=Apiospora aurea TaxID=335848 RepID=A0ABR1PSL0_9PEZI